MAGEGSCGAGATGARARASVGCVQGWLVGVIQVYIGIHKVSDNGKENENYYLVLGFRVQGFGFRVYYKDAFLHSVLTTGNKVKAARRSSCRSMGKARIIKRL